MFCILDRRNTSFNDGYGHNSNFNNENAQMCLVDLSVNNSIYTIENKLLGKGGFGEMINMKNSLYLHQNIRIIVMI